MKIHLQHSWDISIPEAREIQNQLCDRVDLTEVLHLHTVKTVAAADVSFTKKGKYLFGAVVRVSFPDLTILSTHTSYRHIAFPYVPGFLSFREIPVLVDIFKNIPGNFDAVLCDGQGIAHPRRFGLASHLGVLLNKPSVGCAKSRLIGTYKEPLKPKGSYSYLYDDAEKIGVVLRSRNKIKPLFVSPGHRINLESSRKLTMACVGRYRIPEPLRFAHQQVNRVRTEMEKKGF